MEMIFAARDAPREKGRVAVGSAGADRMRARPHGADVHRTSQPERDGAALQTLQLLHAGRRGPREQMHGLQLRVPGRQMLPG